MADFAQTQLVCVWEMCGCVYVCVYICVPVCVHVYVHGCAWIWSLEINVEDLLQSLPSYFTRDLPPNFKLSNSTRLAVQQVPELCPFPPVYL